ncbi:MAG: hypothetical protein Q8R34_01125 [bacterium]|nr:hypothetical protein [bacterium]
MPAFPELKKIEKIIPEEESAGNSNQENSLEFETEGQTENMGLRTIGFLKGGHIDIPDLGKFNPQQEIDRFRQSEKGYLDLPDFKSKLRTFRENLSKAQWDFEKLLKENQEKDLDWLYEEMLRILRRHSVQSQEPQFTNALDKFMEIRRNIKTVVVDYKKRFGENWEVELFGSLWGRPPRGKVEVEIMPINLYFHIYNRQDYVLANQGAEENSQNVIFGLQSAGASLTYAMPLPLLNDLILIENSSFGLTPSEKEAIPIHEEEHAIHKLYPSKTMVKYEESLVASTQLGGEVGLEQFSKISQRHAKRQSLYWEKGAKSEVLAYLKDKRLSLKNIENTLVSSDLYNYFAVELEDQVNRFTEHFKRYGVAVKSETGDGQLSEQEMIESFVEALEKSWEFYKLRIGKAVSAAEALLEEYVNRYGEEEGRAKILRILSQEPLNKWHRLSKLMLNS